MNLPGVHPTAGLVRNASGFNHRDQELLCIGLVLQRQDQVTTFGDRKLVRRSLQWMRDLILGRLLLLRRLNM